MATEETPRPAGTAWWRGTPLPPGPTVTGGEQQTPSTHGALAWKLSPDAFSHKMTMGRLPSYCSLCGGGYSDQVI